MLLTKKYQIYTILTFYTLYKFTQVFWMSDEPTHCRTWRQNWKCQSKDISDLPCPFLYWCKRQVPWPDFLSLSLRQLFVPWFPSLCSYLLQAMLQDPAITTSCDILNVDSEQRIVPLCIFWAYQDLRLEEIIHTSQYLLKQNMFTTCSVICHQNGKIICSKETHLKWSQKKLNQVYNSKSYCSYLQGMSAVITLGYLWCNPTFLVHYKLT